MKPQPAGNEFAAFVGIDWAYALQKSDFLVLFPVHPARLAKYRQSFTPSQAKDDPTDAELQLELLLRHRDKLKLLHPQGGATF